MDQSLGGLGSSVARVKVSNTEVTFDTNTDFNLSFFDSSTPPPSVSKKEPDFLNERDAEGIFESMTSESLFSPVSIKKEDIGGEHCVSQDGNVSMFDPMTSAGEFGSSPFTSEESKYTSFSDAAVPVGLQQTPSSPLQTLSPRRDGQGSRGSQHHNKLPIIIKSGECAKIPSVVK